MSEWLSFLVVFWALWAADSVRLAPIAQYGLTGGKRRAKFIFRRLHRPSWSPAGWRVAAPDIPFAFSPVGICNRPVGSAGRPAEVPAVVSAWAWAEIREAKVADGWLLINGGRFCRDTGHLGAAQLLALAKLDEAARNQRMDFLLRRWLRPAHLRRRVQVLRGRTATPAILNAMFLLLAAAITVFLAGNGAEKFPARWSQALATILPLLAVYLLVLHGTAVVTTWRALRRLRAASPDRRGMNLFSAALLPPQALRLRALAGECFFPAQHPLAYAVAFARKDGLRELAGNALGDLRWPVASDADSPLAKQIVGWFRRELGTRLKSMLRAAGLEESTLFVPPVANSADSASYCPRCGGQFVAGPTRCAQGIELQPLARR